MSKPHAKKISTPILIAVIGAVATIVAAVITIVPNLVNHSQIPDGYTAITNNNFSGPMYFTSINLITKENLNVAGNADIQQELASGMQLAQSKNYYAAIAIFGDIAQRAPSASVYDNLGVLYASTGQYDQAQTAYKEALKLDPNNQATNLNAGLLDKKQGNANAAATEFSQAPDFPNANKYVTQLVQQIENATSVATIVPNQTSAPCASIPVSTSGGNQVNHDNVTLLDGTVITVQADSFNLGGDKALNLSDGEYIPFINMKCFEVSYTGDNVQVTTILLVNGLVLAHETNYTGGTIFSAFNGMIDYGSGVTVSWSIDFRQVKMVQFER